MKRKVMGSLIATVLLTGGVCQSVWAIPGSLPPVQHAGPVSYVSGGVGADESSAIKAQMPKYPLTLEFAGSAQGGNEYLADVPVTIADAHGMTVLDTAAHGPFLLVALQPGRYSVVATYRGKAERREVSVTQHGHVHEFFLWKM